MAQSLSRIYVHLIFSTKNRERTLPDEIRPDLHAFLKAYEIEFDERYVWE